MLLKRLRYDRCGFNIQELPQRLRHELTHDYIEGWIRIMHSEGC